MNTNFESNDMYSANEPAPIKWHMGDGVLGSYAGLRLKPKGDEWRKYPNNPSLKQNPIFVPQGTPLPLKHEELYQHIPDDSMFIFAKNYASPECCPATHSTSTGCVCTTRRQRDYIGVERGGNKTGTYSEY